MLLPASPNPAQMGWMADISSRTGADYDRTFVQRVREAHGTILPAIAAVRSRHPQRQGARQFAEVADSFVTRHHQYLESTGLVNYAALPTPPSPGLLSGSTDPRDLILPIVVFVLTVLGAIALFSALRARGSTRPARVTVPQPGHRGRAAARARRGGRAARDPAASPEMHAQPPDAGGRQQRHSGRLSDTGSYRATDTGAYASSSRRSSGAAPREYRSSSDTGTYRPVSGETETFRAITESDVFRPVSDSGGYRAVTDSGGYRAVTDTARLRHRLPPVGSRSRSRHSIRR